MDPIALPRRATVMGLLAAAAALPSMAKAAITRPPRQVLAFYYMGRGNPTFSGRWIRWQGPTGKEAPDQDPVIDTPLLGQYDSLDPQVMAQHAVWLRQGGMTGVILGAWTRALWEDRDGGPKLQAAMHAQGLKTSVYLEGQKAGREGAEADLRYLYEHAIQHPSWLRVGGRPVLFLYRRALRELPARQWREAAQAVAAEGRAEAILIGEIDPADPDYAEKIKWLDGAHLWSMAEFVTGMTPAQIDAFTDAAYPRWAAKAAGKIRCATVMPGWNDTRILTRPYPRPTTDRFGGATFAALWRGAIRSRADYVLVSTFNAWHNANEVEPSREWGDTTLTANAAFARQFLRGA